MIPTTRPSACGLDRGSRSPDPGKATRGLWNRLLLMLLLAEGAVTVDAGLLERLVGLRRLGPAGPLVGHDLGEALRRLEEVVDRPGPVLLRLLPLSGGPHASLRGPHLPSWIKDAASAAIAFRPSASSGVGDRSRLPMALFRVRT